MFLSGIVKMQDYKLKYGDDAMSDILKRVILFAIYMGIMMLGIKVANFLVINEIYIGSILTTYYMVGFIVSTILGILIYIGKEE